MRKTAVALALLACSVPAQAATVLYYVDDHHGSDSVAAALAADGHAVTVAASWADFNARLAGGGFDLAIGLNQGWYWEAGRRLDEAVLAGYLAGGGRFIFTDWSRDPAYGAPLGFSYTGDTGQTVMTVTDPRLLAGGLTNPITLSNPGWWIMSMDLDGAGSVATFADGSDAIVSGNGGRTLALGFLSDTLPSASAVQFWRNLIAFVFPATTTRALTVFPSGAGAGTVTADVGAISCPDTCTDDLAEGTSVTLTAAPSPTSVFTGWTGCDSVDAAGRCVVTLAGDRSVFATFQATYLLTLDRLGTGQGTVSGVTWDACTPTACTARVQKGTTVTLTAAPGADSLFKGWWACTSVTAAGACRVTSSADKHVSARFDPARYLLTVTYKGLGGGTVAGTAGTQAIVWTGCVPNPLDAAGQNCTALIENGASVTLTATAITGSTFKGWGVVCAGTGLCGFKMNAPKNPWATFSSP